LGTKTWIRFQRYKPIFIELAKAGPVDLLSPVATDSRTIIKMARSGGYPRIVADLQQLRIEYCSTVDGPSCRTPDDSVTVV